MGSPAGPSNPTPPAGPGREIETFQFGDMPLRTVTAGDEPWFVAADVARLLGYRMASDMTRRIDVDDRGTRSVRTPSGEQEMSVISEAGLYAAILGSQVPGAREFKRWVTHVVLPALRRTGRYEVAPVHAIPQTFAAALQLAADQAREIDQQREQLAITAPKADAWDVLASAHGDYSVREAAYMLNRDPAIDTGQKRLFQLLRDWKLVDRRDIPYADHARHVRLRARSYDHPRTGEPQTTEQVRITADGLRYLHRRLGGTQPLAA